MMTTDPLIEVDRAISELRRGAMVRVYDTNKSFVTLAVDALTPDSLNILAQSGTTAPRLLLTGNRMHVLGIDQSDRPVSMVSHPRGLPIDLIEYLANPLSAMSSEPLITDLEIKDADPLANACVTLSKLSRLLPAALIV